MNGWLMRAAVILTTVLSRGSVSLSPASLAAGDTAHAYSQTFSATGGRSPYTYSLLSGVLPPDMTLTSAGVLAGQPTAAATYNFTIRATDAAHQHADRAYSLVIGAFNIATLPALAVRLKADAGTFQDAVLTTPAVADGDPVGGWSDQSGNARHVTQATAGRRALLKLAANGIGGLPALSFDGTDDRLTSAAFGAALAQPNTLYFVYKLASISGARLLCDGLVSRQAVGQGTGANGKYLLNGGTRLDEAGATAETTKAHVAAAVFKGASSALYVDGQLIASGDAGTNSIDGLTIATNAGASGAFLSGLVAEALVFNAEHSAAELTAGQNYLRDHYATDHLVVGFGDSITAGSVASDAAHRWLNIVTASLGTTWSLQNSGISGTCLQNTTQNTQAVVGGALVDNGQDTLASRVLAYRPRMVFVLYGTNDLRFADPAFTAATFQTSLIAIVQAMLAAGIVPARIVLGSPPYIDPARYALFPAPFDAGSTAKHEAYRDIIASVADTYGTKFADVYQYMKDNGGATLISGDNVHPNDAGHAAIATCFESVL